MSERTVVLPSDELELVVDVLFAEAYRRRRQSEDVPEKMLSAMRRLDGALEGAGEPPRFARWLLMRAKQ